MKKAFRKLMKFYFSLVQIYWEVKKEFIENKKIIKEDILEITEENIRKRNIQEIFNQVIFLMPDVVEQYDDCLIRLKRNDLKHRDLTSLHERAKYTTLRIFESVSNADYQRSRFIK
jgi:hypothetical protein